MKILIFTEGTIITHRDYVGLPRDGIIEKIQSGPTLGPEYFVRSVPIGNCVRKIEAWKRQGATIMYLTSRRTAKEVQIIRNILKKFRFPEGDLFSRKPDEAYKDVAKRVLPDIIVEDDCESIGGEKEMTYPHIKPELKSKIKSVVVKEFGGIDHLPDNITELMKFSSC